jgi:hypothetical protein
MPDDTDYYQGGDTAAAPDEAADNAPQTDDPKADDESAGSNSALVPKSLFGDTDPEVGSEVKFRVVHIYDKEVELEPAGEKSKSPTMDDSEDKLGQMAMMNGAATA